MPQPSYTYANARLAALSKRLLDPQTIRRMADGSLSDALRSLQDMRYGGSADGSDADVERLISSELADAAAEVTALSPKPKLTDLFLLKNDVQNLKVLIKARILGISEPICAGCGLYSIDKLREMVKEQEYSDLPAILSDALRALEKRIQSKVDPQSISVSLDRAYLTHALKTTESDRVLSHYFQSMCDFDNILLLPECGVKKQQLVESFDLSYESLNRILFSSVCREPLLKGLNAMQRTGNIGEVEKARDNYLISLLSDHRYETDSIYPVIGYYLAKEREGKAIRLIITAKRNSLADSVIAERLVTLYGER